MLNLIKLEHIQASATEKIIKLNKQQYTFLLITYGSCHFQINKGDIVDVKKGEFILLPAEHTILQFIEKTSVYECFSFTFEASDELINHLPMLKENRVHKNASGLYERTLDRLRPIWQDEQEKRPYNYMRVMALLLDTLVIWQRELDRGELSPASNMQIDRMKSYIQNHYREKVTKDILGDYIKRTPSYAATLFKKGTGQTISEYVHSVRLKTALYMLNNSLLNVTEISEYLGYSDVSYFQRLFKRTFGKTASDIIATRERS